MYVCKPKARISIFRAEVKERCVAAVMLAVDIQNSSAAIAGIIENQLNNFDYIFPRQSKVSRQMVGNILPKMILYRAMFSLGYRFAVVPIVAL